MEHSYYKDKLSAYFDSELEVQEMELLRRHLEGCAECRKLLEKLSSLSQKIEELSGLDENEYFGSLATRIVGKIADLDNKVVELPRKEFHRFGFGWKIGALAASFMLIATVTYYQWQDHESILDEILELPTKPAQPIRVLGGSEVQSESVLEKAPEEKANDNAVTSQVKEIEKDRPAAVVESKTMREPRMIVKPEELKGMTKFKTSRQSIIKAVPDLKQEQVKEDESKGDIAKDYVANIRVIESDAAEDLLLATPPVAKIIAQAEEEDVAIESIQYWRAKRDSIVSLSAESSRVHSARKSRLTIITKSDISASYRQGSTLALVWYKIGLLTVDSAEKKEALEYLESYLKIKRADSALVEGYLEKLKD